LEKKLNVEKAAGEGKAAVAQSEAKAEVKKKEQEGKEALNA